MHRALITWAGQSCWDLPIFRISVFLAPTEAVSLMVMRQTLHCLQCQLAELNILNSISLTALKIHISGATQYYLERIGGYIMKERGAIDIKVCEKLWLRDVSRCQLYNGSKMFPRHWPHMFSALDSESKGLSSSPSGGALCCVLGQRT